MRRPTILLMSALGLTACGQPSLSPAQPVVTAPGTSTPVGAPTGLYRISFQQVGSAAFDVSAQQLTPGGLEPQRLTDTTGTFTFTRVATSTFVVAATRVRHVQATFRVTNDTGRTLNSLKFVPAVPAGASSVFSGVTYFDGSDASSRAGSLTPVQGQQFVAATGEVVTDAGTSPYVTGLDVSGVDTGAQGASSVENAGWQVAARLAPGEAATVTFAVNLPADADPKNDPFNFSLNVVPVQEGTTLTSAVQQFNRVTKSFGNYVQFPTMRGTSLPAYYDVVNVDRTGASVAAVLCSFDGATVENISDATFPNRYRVRVTKLGPQTVQVYEGGACPAVAGTPILSQTVVGVAPQRVPLAGGGNHGLALSADGTVRSWGNNVFGQLGNGTTANSPTPVTVTALTDVVSLAGGGRHSLALKADGTVRSWGYNLYGQLGNGTTANSPTPVTVTALTDVVALAGSGSHSLALRVDGTVRSWGYNFYGQLGNGTTANSPTPVTVTGLTDVVALVGSGGHSLALKADGTVRSWGYNAFGQLGNDTTTSTSVPVTVTALTGVVGLACGDTHSLALKADGTVRSWGSGVFGKLGNGTQEDSLTAVMVQGLTDVTGIAGGTDHSLALKADGTVRSWGENFSGKLGNGTNMDAYTPVTVTGLTDVTGIDGGSSHSVALKADGTVRSWGFNGSGQFGNGTTTQSRTPVLTFIEGVMQPTP